MNSEVSPTCAKSCRDTMKVAVANGSCRPLAASQARITASKVPPMQ